MLSASEVRKILDEIAVEVGIQKIDEKKYGNVYHYVFYHMSGTGSCFMYFKWYNNGAWIINIADRIMCDSKICTTGNMIIYPRGFNNFTTKMIKERLEELITNFNKALKYMKQKEKDQKIKEILNTRGKYDV